MRKPSTCAKTIAKFKDLNARDKAFVLGYMQCALQYKSEKATQKPPPKKAS